MGQCTPFGCGGLGLAPPHARVDLGKDAIGFGGEADAEGGEGAGDAEGYAGLERELDEDGVLGVIPACEDPGEVCADARGGVLY